MDESLREKIMRWLNQEKTDPPRKWARGRGRIEERHRNVHPRVRHQYPSTNAEQESTRGHVHMRSVTPQTDRHNDRREQQRLQKQQESGNKDSTSNTKASETQPEREKFTGVDFHAADIPSPVYGFRKRPDIGDTVSAKEEEETDRQAKQKTTDHPEANSTQSSANQHEKESGSVQDDAPVSPSVTESDEEDDLEKGEQVQDQHTPESLEEGQNKPSWVETTIRDQEEALRLIRLRESSPNEAQSEKGIQGQESLRDAPSTAEPDAGESSRREEQEVRENQNASPPPGIEEPNQEESNTEVYGEEGSNDQAPASKGLQNTSEPLTEEEASQTGGALDQQESSNETWQAPNTYTSEAMTQEGPGQAEISTQEYQVGLDEQAFALEETQSPPESITANQSNQVEAAADQDPQKDLNEARQTSDLSESSKEEKPSEIKSSVRDQDHGYGVTSARSEPGMPEDTPDQASSAQTTESHGEQSHPQGLLFEEPQETVSYQSWANEEQEQTSKEGQSTPEATVEAKEAASRSFGELPSLALLSAPEPPSTDDGDWIETQRQQLADTLAHFHVKAEVTGVTKGPAVTRFEVQPAPGVKVNKIKKLSDDLKLSLAAKDIRIEAPIPGKSTVGIEIPNPVPAAVSLREMIESQAFQDESSPLAAALGQDIAGTPIITDLQKMPHGLISGATGSGKSVCINSLLISLLYKATPAKVKMILIDPKVVELAPFRDIPHLAAPVINDPKEAAQALKWAVEEMERRYERFAEAHARDIARYNRRMKEQGRSEETLPYLVIVIDELADLMMVSPQDVEDAICRIAQKARACGIHLVVATQRPSVDVITGLIKANIPTRIAFSVSSQADSRTILDTGGAEKLLGHGDMLFVENGAPQTVRIQGNFVSDEEIDRVTEFVRDQAAPDYLFEKENLKEADTSQSDQDALFEDAAFFVFEQGTASTSSLQRHFRIGYNRAARLIDSMEAYGMISEARGSKPRELLMTEDEFLERIMKIEA